MLFRVADAILDPISVRASVAPSPVVKQESVTPDLRQGNDEKGKGKSKSPTKSRSNSINSREKTLSGDEMPDHVSETEMGSERIPYKDKRKVESEGSYLRRHSVV